jgi:uncharacterized phage-associated protein
MLKPLWGFLEVPFILSKSPQKEIDVLHLIKILYFADKECLKEYNFTITGDSFASLPYGPVVSKTYDILKNPSSEKPFFRIHRKEV